MRDHLKDAAYFDAYIAKQTKRMEMFEDRLAKGEVADVQILTVRHAVHAIKTARLLASYSRGDDLEVLRNEFLALAQEWPDLLSEDFYSRGLEMLSLGVLFHVDMDMFKSVMERYKAAGTDDWLYDFLVSGGADPKRISTKLRFPKTYGTLKWAILRGGFNGDDIKEYLKYWYNRHGSCGWYNSHKSKQMTYYGYWSLEIGAVVKLLHVEDSAFRNAKYYPYDLVHF